jgi:putative membrane protein
METFMRTGLLLLCFVGLAACSQMGMKSPGQSAGQGATASTQDAKFARDIAQANLAEIETGKLAASKAQSDAVKQFAQHMVDEHSKLLKQGSDLAAAKGMQVPSAPGLEHQAAKTKLQVVTPASFDRAYMEQMVKDHNTTLELLNRTVAEASDPQLRAQAQQAIPHVQQHLEMAQRLAAQTTSAR